MTINYTSQQKILVKKLEDSFATGHHQSSIVEMLEDYASSDQRCLTSVVFIPKSIADKITNYIINPLKEIEPDHYYYPPESMHLTIKNIRTVNYPPLFNETDINKANELFQKVVPKYSAFNFNVEDVVLFPTSLSVMSYSSDVLQKLVMNLDNGLKEISVPDNKKYISDTIFWGNITVCRFTKQPSEKFVEMVKKMRSIKIDELKVEKISLITCNAVCHKNTKEIIAEYKLKVF